MIVGYVGRLEEPKKGVSVLLRAAALCQTDHFVIIGDGPARKDLMVLRDKLNLFLRVTFIGEQVKPFDRPMDILVVPSLWEGFGLVILEAMKHRVPVIASRVGGIPEIIEDMATGILVQPDNPIFLAVAIQWLRSEKDRKEMADAAYKRLDQFRLEDMIRKIEIIYEKVGGGGRL